MHHLHIGGTEELWPGVLGYMGEDRRMADVWGDSGLSLMDSREEGDPGTYPNAPVMPQLTGLGLSQCPGLTHAPVGLFSWLPSRQSESDSYSGGWGDLQATSSASQKF